MDMLLKGSILLFKVQVDLYSSVSLYDQDPQIEVTSKKIGFSGNNNNFSKLACLGIKFGH